MMMMQMKKKMKRQRDWEANPKKKVERSKVAKEKMDQQHSHFEVSVFSV